MVKKINIKINNRQIACAEGESVLDVAKKAGIFIPTLCHHPDFPVKGNCRVCLVEIKRKGDRSARVTTSCSTKAEAGMEVRTDTKQVSELRNMAIEMIFAEHIQECAKCVWSLNCPLLELARKYDIKISRFSERKAKRKTYKFANAVEIDGSQCIDCRNCLDACSLEQDINYLKMKGKGSDQEIVPVSDKEHDCIYCGQCALHCPVSAAQEQSQWEEVEKKMKDKKRVMVAQFAPSIRVSIGEEFGFPYGEVMTGQIVPALKALGFDYVFDVNFGADVTTMVEASELIERIKKGGKRPMFTSCCPAWVKYVEFYYPKLIPYLTTSRSPHIHLGGIIKAYWAGKNKINPSRVEVVSVMPCTAKKFESSRRELDISRHKPVDNVITTREFAYLIKKKGIKFGKLTPREADNPMGAHSGAAAIYGASGGVMESALRTASHLICEEDTSGICKSRLSFKSVRGMNGVKEAKLKLGKQNFRVAVVNGIKNAPQIIESMDNYDYVEVMACPGGCIGGGGQPIPTTREVREKRIEALYTIDTGKKIRKAHDNEAVMKIMDWTNKQRSLGKKILHTKYKKRK